MTKRRPPAEFDTIAEVLDFRAFQRLARVSGDVAELTRVPWTLTSFTERDYWRHAERRLAASTVASYRSVWRNHVGPHVGHVQLRGFDSGAAVGLRDLLVDEGVGAPTVRRALMLLQAVYTRAIELRVVKRNPIRDVTKPSVNRQLAINAPGPDQIESLREQLAPADAALVSLLGYEGLRPSEALALEERHIRRATLLVEQRVIAGQVVVGLKTSGGRERSHRSPDLWAPVREDLERHVGHLGRRRSGRRLLFAREDGSPWTPYDYRRWRETVFAPAVERAGVDLGRVYDLRHGCASLLLHSGRPVSEIGEHMGHTVATLSSFYSHVIRDLRDQDPIDVETQILAARRERAPRTTVTMEDIMRQTR